MELKTIAVIRNGFKDKFGVPRQSGMVDEAISEIIFEKEYRDENALCGIENYSHLWLLWMFSENPPSTSFSPTVRPPRLGGNKRVGVFATRSPFRPNAIGLSSVKLLGVEKRKGVGNVLIVSGADMTDGTPIVDIKPYIKYADCHPDAIGGFGDEFASYRLNVSCPDSLKDKIDKNKFDVIKKLIACDPRPSYQNNPERIYKMDYDGYNVSFKIDNNVAFVLEIIKMEDENE